MSEKQNYPKLLQFKSTENMERDIKKLRDFGFNTSDLMREAVRREIEAKLLLIKAPA